MDVAMAGASMLSVEPAALVKPSWPVLAPMKGSVFGLVLLLVMAVGADRRTVDVTWDAVRSTPVSSPPVPAASTNVSEPNVSVMPAMAAGG
jgi:hypothetical protein